MAITEDKRRFIGGQDSHVQDAGKQSSESSWQDAVHTGALAVRHSLAVQSQKKKEKHGTTLQKAMTRPIKQERYITITKYAKQL